MKKHITHAALLLCTVLTVAASCSKEATGEGGAAGTGVLEMNISTTRAEADAEYDPKDHLVARIYNSRNELIRKYTSETFVKQLELIAGEYRIAVEAGEAVPASFTKRFYKGEETFTVTPGKTTEADVNCRRQNTAAEVKFDASVATAFGTNFRFWIVADDAFDEEKAEQEAVPALKYTSDATGYFTLPEGVTTFVWHFEGTHSERGQIVMEGRQENIQAGGKYVFTCLFSKDLPGFIQCVVIKVNTDPDEQDDTIIFSPDPTIEGDGFDIAQPQGYIPGDTWTRSYKLAAMAPLKTAELRFGEQTYDLMMSDAPAEGITVVRDNDLSLTVTLSEAFLAGCPAGSHSASFHIADTKDAEATVASELRVQGILLVGKEDYDLWANTVTLRAVVVDPNVSAVTFGLKNGESWLETEGTADGNGCYTATYRPEWTESTNEAGLKVYTPKAGTGIWADGSYEFRAVLGDDTTYNTDLTTAEGQTIPGGDMEDGNLPCFGKSTSETTTFWGSGNAATSGLCSQGTKPGMGGNHCAVLQSQSAFSLLAAGNLFSATFKFASLLGTVSFGMPYDWQARPTAMRVKCHATVGAVNKGTITDEHEYIQDGQDRSRIYVAIVDWNSRHQTSTGMNAPTGTWDPAKTNETAEGKIIAYGSLLIKDSTEGDEMVSIDIPICYYDPETKPSKSYSLIISCSTSTYGDYKVGCLGNVMYVDDFEWVY